MKRTFAQLSSGVIVCQVPKLTKSHTSNSVICTYSSSMHFNIHSLPSDCMYCNFGENFKRVSAEFDTFHGALALFGYIMIISYVKQ